MESGERPQQGTGCQVAIVSAQRKGVSSSFIHSAISWLSYRFVIDILRILPIDSKNLAVKTSDLQNDTCYISSSTGRTSRKVFFTEKCRITCSIISTAGHSCVRYLSSKMAKIWMAPMTRVATGIKSYPKKQESQFERVGGMFLCRDGENTDRNHQPAYGDFLKWGYP